MIDPKELRIGNLVEWYGAEVKVTGIRDGIYTESPPRHLVENMQPCQPNPIPITPEWLERLFDVSADDLIGRSGCCLCEILPDIWLRYNDYGTGEILIEEYREGAVRIPHIRYVHQLQNLYFALTGEELKIKE